MGLGIDTADEASAGRESAPPLAPAFALALGPVALGAQLGLRFADLGVLADEDGGDAVGALADVGGVLKEALRGALQGDDHLAERRVRDRFHPAAQAALD